MDCYKARRGGLMRVIVSDTFTRANGYIGNAETGQNWLTTGSAWLVASNVAQRSAATAATSSVAYIDIAKSDVIVSANFRLGGYAVHSIIARMSGDTVDNSIRFSFSPGGNVSIIRTISGVNTVLATAAHSYSAGSTYACSLSCIGNDFTATVDGAVVVSVTDDNALKTNTKVGMYLPFASAEYPITLDYMDNFLARG